MTVRKLLLSAPIRAVLVLLALVVVLGPMFVVASVWGVNATVVTAPATWWLFSVIVGAVVCAFLAGAAIAYVAKLGADVHVHAAIVVERRTDDV